VFRDKKGRVGALDPHCAHRGTSLEWGRVEEEGLRCCYHGRPEFRDRHYASFRTGPSATADIEGVLIHGAQGVRSLSVLPLARSAGSPTQ
jgi:hypothetical protein